MVEAQCTDGFAAGTLVHTREDLRPIEAIAVGDCVLSRPETGEGEPGYKRVTRTFSCDDREVFFLNYAIVEPDVPADRRKYGQLVVTGAHPLRVRSLLDRSSGAVRPVNAWMSPAELFEAAYRRLWDDQMQPMLAELELHDGRTALLEYRNPLLATSNPDLGVVYTAREFWREQISGPAVHLTPQGPRVEFAPGGGLEYATMDVEEEIGEEHPEDSVIRRSGYQPLRRQVFNLEVEGNHAYYVGESGVLVHDGRSEWSSAQQGS